MHSTRGSSRRAQQVTPSGFDGTRNLSDIDLFWTRYPDGRQFAVFYIQLEP
jgi:hypothetical protein